MRGKRLLGWHVRPVPAVTAVCCSWSFGRAVGHCITVSTTISCEESAVMGQRVVVHPRWCGRKWLFACVFTPPA